MDALKVGQTGTYRQFTDDRLVVSFMVVCVKVTKDEYKFQINSSGKEFLTVSKNCYPVHEWNSSHKDFPINHKTIIEMY